MLDHLKRPTKLLSVAILLAITSACSFTGTPQQLAEARAVHAFDENRAPFGQRIAAAQAQYKPRLFGHNPYFGR